MILWICGQSGSGKTTLAIEVVRVYGGLHLDGNTMRGIWSLGFSKKDRAENNMRIAKMAKVLDDQGFDVVVSTICPYRNLRQKISSDFGVNFINLGSIGLNTKEFPFEDDNG